MSKQTIKDMGSEIPERKTQEVSLTLAQGPCQGLQLVNSGGEAERLRRASGSLPGVQYLPGSRVFACGSYGARSEK